MIRLIHDTGENSPEGYDEIYKFRKEKGPDPHDVKRWKKLLQYYRGGKLIDLGCLDSLIPKIAKEWYPKAEVWGVDTAVEAIRDMQGQIPEAIFTVEDVYKLRFPKNYFAYATAGELIEHLDDPERFFAEAFRVLKTGGILAISTPLEEVREPGAVDGHRHIWSYDLEDMQKLMGPYGKVWTKTMGSELLPYKYHWKSIISYCRKI